MIVREELRPGRAVDRPDDNGKVFVFRPLRINKKSQVGKGGHRIRSFLCEPPGFDGQSFEGLDHFEGGKRKRQFVQILAHLFMPPFQRLGYPVSELPSVFVVFDVGLGVQPSENLPEKLPFLPTLLFVRLDSPVECSLAADGPDSLSRSFKRVDHGGPKGCDCVSSGPSSFTPVVWHVGDYAIRGGDLPCVYLFGGNEESHDFQSYMVDGPGAGIEAYDIHAAIIARGAA